MPSDNELRLTELMWDAMRSEHGILVRLNTGNVVGFKNRLYVIRRKYPEMEVLHLEQSSHPREIYITKRT